MYYVMRMNGGTKPVRIHLTLLEAEREAIRLGVKDPTGIFLVLKIVSGFRPRVDVDRVDEPDLQKLLSPPSF